MRIAKGWWLVVATANACDKGNDSANAEGDTDTDSDTDSDTDADSDTDSDTDTDADTDSDSDTDTDTDTDTDADTGFTATIAMTVTTQDDVLLCDSTIELSGTPYVGDCPECDFSYALTGKVTSELGTKCDYDRYTPFATYLPTALFPSFYWGFSHDDDGYDLVWAGYTYYAGPGLPPDGPYWNSAVYTGPYGSSDWGSTTYSKGVVDWAMRYRTQYVQVASIGYCHAESGYAGTASYGGAYAQTSALDCDDRHYDLWSFQGVTTGYAYVTVDTVSAKTTFDPILIVMDSDRCYLGEADDSFECTYPPPLYDCPSYGIRTTEGDGYYVMVRARGHCADTTGEYTISVDAASDPSLTLEVGDAEFYHFEEVDVTAAAHLP